MNVCFFFVTDVVRDKFLYNNSFWIDFMIRFTCHRNYFHYKLWCYYWINQIMCILSVVNVFFFTLQHSFSGPVHSPLLLLLLLFSGYVFWDSWMRIIWQIHRKKLCFGTTTVELNVTDTKRNETKADK